MNNPFAFLISTVFDLYTVIVMLRLLLQLCRADFFNPVSQFVVKATDPILKPVRMVLPAVPRLDLAALLVAYLLLALKSMLIYWISEGVIYVGLAIWVVALRDLLLLAFHVLFWATLARVILSWISPSGYNPALALLLQITDFFLKPIQRMLPAFGGLDFSPLVLLIGLQFLIRVLLSLLPG